METVAVVLIIALVLALTRIASDNIRLAKRTGELAEQLEAVTKSHEQLTSGVIKACHEQMRLEQAVRERARVAQWN